MVSILRAAGSNGPRPMNPFRDWGGVAQLMRLAFQSEVTTASLPLLPDWPSLRWLHSLVGVFESLGMEAPEQMFGYVWEESGRIVGNATIGLSSANRGTWLLSNVAVHPAYRRRGIARALLEMAIKESRQHGGRYLTLQVQSDNDGATALYRRLGFSTLEQVSELAGAHVRAPREAQSSLSLAAPTPAQWRAVQAMVNAHLPAALHAYRHSLAGMFQGDAQRRALSQLGDLLRGLQRARWCLLREQQVIGAVVVQAQLSWGGHRVAAHLLPSAYGQAEELVLGHSLRLLQHYSARRITFHLPAQHVNMRDVLRQYGFREMRTLDLMGLPL